MKITSILFTTDFSSAAAAALPYAVEMAKTFGAKLYVLYVMTDFSLTSELSMPYTAFDQIYDELESSAQKELEKLKINKEGLADFEYDVVRGLPYEEIIKFATNKKIDLIVMSSHGKTGVDRVLFGSTTQRVVRRARCPVLTVRAQK